MDERNTAISVLTISPHEADLVLVSNLISHSAWNHQSAKTIEEALTVLESSDVHVILCDADLPGGGWEGVLERAADLDRHPETVVLARHPDERLWAKVLNLGAWDLLAKPLQPKEFYRSVHHAFRHWSEKIRAVRKSPGSETASRSSVGSSRTAAVAGAGR